MTLDLFDVLLYVGRGAGLLAGVVTAYRLATHRDRRSLDIFLAVASSSLSHYIGGIWIGDHKLEWLKLILYIAHPILFLRLARYYANIPLWVFYAGGVVTIARIASRLDWLPRIDWLIWLSGATFLALLVYAAWVFLVEAHRRTGVTSKRLWYAGAAAAIYAPTQLPYGLFGLPELESLLGRTFRALAELHWIALYIAFVTPRRLVNRWQLSPQVQFARELGEHAPRELPIVQALNRAAAGVSASKVVGCAVRLPSDDGQTLSVAAATSPGLIDVRVTPSDGAMGRSLKHGTPLEIPVEDLEHPLAERGKTFGESAFVVPIVGGDRVWGAVVAVHRRQSLFADEELPILSNFARQAGLALDHARLAAEERDRERKAAERRVREIESRVSLMLESIKDYALVVTDDDGLIVGWQPGAEHVFGFTEAEIRDRSAARLFSLSDAELQVRLDDARTRAAAEYEGTCRRKDGTAFTGQTTIRRLMADGDHVDGFVLVTRDVTERRLLENRLHHSEKLEAVGVLAGGVAHDFNNLLAAIIGYAGLVQMSLPPDDPNYEHVEEIQVVAERAALLTQQLLAFSRRQTLTSAVIDLAKLVEELLPILRSLVGAEIRIVHEGGPVWPITADPSQIDRVLVNLTTNARDAMPEGGTLTLRTGNVALDGTRVDLPAGDYVLLEVSDTGIGMDEATRARIFEPFFSTHELGRGLGLAAVYGIVAQMHGAIAVDSRPQQGATFRLYFPRTQAAAPSRVEEPHTAAVALSPNGAVVLVEDDDSVRSFLCQLLEKEGFRVLAADRNAAALQMIAAANEPISLIITDVMMPDGGGPALVAAAERIRPSVPVLYISGHEQPAVLAGTGATFLQKPFSSDELLAHVRRAVMPPQ